MSHRVGPYLLLVLITTACMAQRPPVQYDVIVRNGIVYDGLGGKPKPIDIGINGDTIAALGDLSLDIGKKDLNVHGLAVTPGFINMLSWAGETLTHDGRSMSDIKQ